MRAASSSTLVRHWLPERSLVGDTGLVLAFSLFPFLIGDAIKLAAATAVLPAGWRLSRAR